ncbi:hypothetical protein LV779_07040 [Streptomyces thinghirensis]|nr:hypothetical protein [Streptomyces thinghirensis]
MSLTWKSRFAASWGRFLVAHCEEVDLAAHGRGRGARTRRLHRLQAPYGRHPPQHRRG